MNFAARGETMRRTLRALAFVLGFGLPLIALSPVQAQTDVTGPVAFTVHKASCPIDYAATSTGGIYEACHENKVEGVTFTISGAEFDPLAFFTDAEGVGVAMITRRSAAFSISAGSCSSAAL